MAMVALKEIKMRRTFADLVDVNDVEIGFLRAFIDMVYKNKISEISSNKDLQFKVQGNNYFVGKEYPELWNCIKRTDIEELLSEEAYRTEIKTGLANLPKLLKNYLKNKYNMALIDGFVGINLIDEVAQAENFNIAPLVSFNSDALPSEWLDAFEKHSNGNSEKKASYLATMETMDADGCFALFELMPNLFDVFDMIQKISDDTQEFDDKVTKEHWENKYTGHIIEDDDALEVWREIANELATDYTEDEDDPDDIYIPKTVSRELWLECKDIRENVPRKIYDKINEKLEAFKASGSKKGIRALNRELEDLKNSIPREINMEIRKQKADKIREYMEDAWIKKESKVERPFSFNEDILDDLDAWDNPPPDNAKIETWYSPIISAWHNQLSKDSSLADFTNDLFYQSQLFV